jgi:hypothetical protein
VPWNVVGSGIGAAPDSSSKSLCRCDRNGSGAEGGEIRPRVRLDLDDGALGPSLEGAGRKP